MLVAGRVQAGRALPPPRLDPQDVRKLCKIPERAGISLTSSVFSYSTALRALFPNCFACWFALKGFQCEDLPPYCRNWAADVCGMCLAFRSYGSGRSMGETPEPSSSPQAPL